MKRARAKNTLVGRIAESQEKRSLLPLGRSVRAAVWSMLRPMPPWECDRLLLWEVGALLGHHLVDKGADDPEVREAQTTLKKRGPVIESFMDKRKERKKGRRKR